MIALVLLWGCTVPCGDRPPGLERDQCTYDELLALPPDQADAVLARVARIQDPVIRGTAVSRWVGTHARQLDPGLGQQLCATLEGPDQGQCLRRLQSAHLQR